ncbi:MAG: ATP-binding protein [Pseudanabaena sp. M135S2SP2A07QC]|nr:ATP-binding protein [Pseudanabaena sp. M172S2SP2A07QC]MCA6520672.1 ATP-binding protein [Pseudanabaena sp. M051S1SP2A07QC]MCA6526607.1 ATP-binding protein [Pseudanabaena sp. M179S2SP2A07QC]MCA6529886.1 ATP-binding protein [Pseudanabaena sp. M125S2SP2A07QC]MCA6532673.1 ATP-binding protein [Pseudanabaena sp. M176S2SP2A07QC]MCA6539873.1 ATP-binding protein [Pseudanabaena sp. M037S2SP2A07QC]MCA6545330.1 ATP-binding protein [Pseudanabaena sp. M074S1SP2A07QC]MCA6547412.1 ATP-binding protein [Pse
MTDLPELDLPLTYEATLNRVSNDIAKMAEFIVPVTKFEEQIIHVINDIKESGYILFLYGISGVGKSTFIGSLEWRAHIPIRKIVNINASDLNEPEQPGLKLKKLYAKINQIVRDDKQTSSPKSKDKLCIIIDYLESLQEESLPDVRAIFRDLNGLLRNSPVLIVWPVTEREDLEKMQEYASSFSSSLFHKRIPVMEFTGPPVEDYPKIAKNTISFFNHGRTYHDFQLHDSDFESIKESYESKPVSKQIIKDYLKDIKLCWEDKTNYIEKISKTVPKQTEIWFIVCYPEAEEVVSRFAKQTFDVVDETWNADYSQLSVYTKDNQAAAKWTPQRLSLALNGVFDTKIMYIPTNTLISCFAAYAEDAGIPISREEFENWGVPKHWLQKHPAKNSLSTTPLYLKLAGEEPKKGKRKSGSVPGALEKAKPIFERLNKDYISGAKGSDRPFNKALCLALSDIFSEEKPDLTFHVEQTHPWLQYIRPDILIDVPNQKCICIEMHYTIRTAPNVLAKYILGKLDNYMRQVEKLYDSGQIPILEITRSL